MNILVDFLTRATSRKFLAAVACFLIVMLDGLGAAEFNGEVLTAASIGLVSYLAVQGYVDSRLWRPRLP